MLISTFFKENTNTGARAEVHETPNGYEIQYYDMNGSFMMSEEYHDKQLDVVKSMARNWTMGVSLLNG